MNQLMQPPSPAQFWQAVQGRDRRFDGVFFYGVASTGIYCRPSCPSRRPSAKQVEFFSNSASAEKSGYRACLRCKPQNAATGSPEFELIHKVCSIIDEKEMTPSLEELSLAVRLTPSHLQRTFKKFVGISPREYAAARKLQRLKAELRKSDDVTTAIYSTGFGSSSRVYERSNAALGMSPRLYRMGAPEQDIAYAIQETDLGLLIVARTSKGVCCVRFGDSIQKLREELAKEFP